MGWKSSLPSQQLIAYNASQNASEEEVEEILLSLLRSSSQLDVKAANNHNSTSLITWMVNYFYSVDISPHEDENLSEWKCTLELLKKMLKPDDSYQNSVIPGHVLFRIVLADLSSSLDNEVLSPFDILCMVLLCEGLKASHSCQVKRWKRLRSMSCESIAIYQRLLSRYFSFATCKDHTVISDGIHSSESIINFTSIVFVDHFVPVISIILANMSESEAHNSHIELGIASGLVNLALTSGRIIQERSTLAASNHETILATALNMRLFECIKGVSDILFDCLILHPFFEHSSSYSDESMPCVTGYLQQLELKNNILMEISLLIRKCSTDRESDDLDELYGVQTYWDPVAVASLIYIVYKEGRLFSSYPYLASMKSCAIRDFEFLFPHLAILLGQHDRYFDQDTLQSCYYHSGLDWLSALLVTKPTIKLPPMPKESLLNPLKVFQLIFNHIAARLIKHLEISYTTIENTLILQRKLLSVYDTRDAISTLKELIRHCPFPFVLPKLIDMLRPFVIQIGNGDQDLLSYIVSAVHEFLEEMSELSSKNCFGRLLDKVEIYSSTISMLHLCLTFNLNVVKVLDNLHLKLLILSKELTMNIDDWIEEDTSNHQRFRLYLLEDSLRRLFEFKLMASTSMN